MSAAPDPSTPQHYLYLRRCRLMILNDRNAIDLSNLRFEFVVSQADIQTPNICAVRVYNLKTETVYEALREFNRVTIEAGYIDGPFGMIFAGVIKQFRKGHLSAIDTYLDIFGSDGDYAHQFAIVSASLPAGANGHQAQLDSLQKAAQPQGVTSVRGADQMLPGGALPRGKVQYGMLIDGMRGLARNAEVTWSIQNNNTLVLVRKDGYLPGEIVEITSRNGMVGFPEATDNGITCRVLLNPLIGVGTLIHINNQSINQTLWQGQTISGFSGQPGVQGGLSKTEFPSAFGGLGFPGKTDFPIFFDVTADGIYKVLVAEHTGDTRGTPFYTDLVCQAIDPSSNRTVDSQANKVPTPPERPGLPAVLTPPPLLT